jgi:hypothetical protein
VVVVGSPNSAGVVGCPWRQSQLSLWLPFGFSSKSSSDRPALRQVAVGS